MTSLPTLLTTTDDTEEEDYSYHRGIPERVVFMVDDGSVIICYIEPMDPNEERLGMASCEADNGCLDYLIQGIMIDKPRNGFYAMDNVSVSYSQDYWGEVDSDLEGDEVRPANLYEIRETGEGITVRTFLGQLWLHLIDTWGVDL